MTKWLFSHPPVLRIWILLLALGAFLCILLWNIPVILVLAVFLALALIPPLFVFGRVDKECRKAVSILDEEGNGEPLYRFALSFPKRNLLLSLNLAVALQAMGRKREAYDTLLSARPARFSSPLHAVMFYNNLSVHAEEAAEKRTHYESAKGYLLAVRSPGMLADLTNTLRSTEAEILLAEKKYEECLALSTELLAGKPRRRGYCELLLLKAKCLYALGRDREDATTALKEIITLTPKLYATKEAEELLNTLTE